MIFLLNQMFSRQKNGFCVLFLFFLAEKPLLEVNAVDTNCTHIKFKVYFIEEEFAENTTHSDWVLNKFEINLRLTYAHEISNCSEFNNE